MNQEWKLLTEENHPDEDQRVMIYSFKEVSIYRYYGREDGRYYFENSFSCTENVYWMALPESPEKMAENAARVEFDWLLADRGKVEAFLEKIPEGRVIDRASFQSQLNKTNAKIAKMEARWGSDVLGSHSQEEKP